MRMPLFVDIAVLRQEKGSNRMFCQNCGKQLPEDNHFCQYCGAPLVKIQHSPEQTAKPKTKAKQINTARNTYLGFTWFGLIILIGTLIGIAAVAVDDHFFSPEAQLIGRWQIEGDGNPEYLEFDSDGTLTMEYQIIWQDSETEVYNYYVEDGTLVLEDLFEEDVTTTIDFEQRDDYLEIYPNEEDMASYRRI